MLLDIIIFIVKSLMVTGGILTIAMRESNIFSNFFGIHFYKCSNTSFVLFHVEYFAILLILVYLGAIAVLFLFLL